MRLILLLLLASVVLPPQGLAKNLINFDRGEISSGVAQSVERTAPGEYTLVFPGDFTGEKIARIKKLLENQFRSSPQVIKISEKKKSLIIAFKGPDTPLLKALSQINVEG